MNSKTIRITQNDLEKLLTTLHDARRGAYRSSPYLDKLEGELARAEVVEPKKIPADVITMNSRVVLTDVTHGEQMTLKLVFPDAGSEEDAVSVLAPIGTAMIGYRVGDVFDWDTPDGAVTLRVDKILFQPEASGIYD